MYFVESCTNVIHNQQSLTPEKSVAPFKSMMCLIWFLERVGKMERKSANVTKCNMYKMFNHYLIRERF